MDAIDLAKKAGMGGRINTIMQAAFFKVAGIIPEAEAIDYMKQAVKKTYGKKGDKIVQMNNNAIDMGAQGIQEINYPESCHHHRGCVVCWFADAGEFFAGDAVPDHRAEG